MPENEAENRTVHQTRVPFIGLKEGVIFPETEAVLTFGKPTSISGINSAYSNNEEVCFVSQKDSKATATNLEDYYLVGTVCRIVKTLPVNEELHAIVKGLFRVKIESIEQEEGLVWAVVSEYPEDSVITSEISALSNRAVALIKRASELGKANIEPGVLTKILSSSDPLLVSFQISSILDVKNVEKQQLLENSSLEKRLSHITDHLTEEIKILELEKKIENKTQKRFDDSMKEAVLRERMRAIQKELGEGGEEEEITELKTKLKKANLPKEIHTKVNKELDRLKKLSIHNPETSYLRTWIETILELPWGEYTKSSYSLLKAEKILDQDHYGLEKVK
jgi:ATP-dependent Lon protease